MHNYSDEDGQRRGRYPYNDRGGYPPKRPRARKDSGGSIDSDRPSSPKYSRNRSASVSSQSDRRRSSTPDNESYSGSDFEGRGKSSSPSRSSVGAPSQKNTSIQIKNISTRPGDNSVKEALFHEFKKVGEIINIKIIGSEKERYALIKFRRAEDAEKSLQSNNKTFLGNEMKISIFKGENKDKDGEASFSMHRKKYRSKESGADDVHFDPMATRTLFVGNLDKMLTHGELRKIFEKFGEVVDVDIKKQNPGITTYAFLQYVDINGAMRAKQRMDREIIRGNRIKVGFGRGTPTNTIWIGNVARETTEGQMQRQFHPFGYVTRVIVDRQCWQGLVSFDTIDAAAYAFDNMRGRYVLGRKLLVDFASRSCKEGFYERMERTGQLDRRTLEPSPPPVRSSGSTHSGFMQGGYSGRGRGFRGGFNKGYGYGRYGSERSGHGEYREFSQGSQEYYQSNAYPDDDYDDYEKELRDYGYRQRERERERESGRRSERDSSRNRDREYSGRERQRERRRAYTPLTDEEHPNSTEQKSDNEDDDDDDDDDVHSEKDIQSKIVKPEMVEKRKRSEDESAQGDSPDVSEEIERKVEKKDKKKKKEKKEKSEKKRKIASEKDLENEDDDNVEEKGLKELDTKALKAEKKKKRKLSEKGLAAEEKARRKELRKLKKLRKLQAELGKNEDLQQMLKLGEAAFEKEAGNDKEGVFEREAAFAGEDFQLTKDKSETEPLSPSSEDRKGGRDKDLGQDSDSDKDRLEELERKREELRRLEEDEKRLREKIVEDGEEEKIKDDKHDRKIFEDDGKFENDYHDGKKKEDDYRDRKEIEDDNRVEKKIKDLYRDEKKIKDDEKMEGDEFDKKKKLADDNDRKKLDEELEEQKRPVDKDDYKKDPDLRTEHGLKDGDHLEAKDSTNFESVNSDSDQSDLVIDENKKSTPVPDEDDSKKLQSSSKKNDAEQDVCRRETDDRKVDREEDMKDSERKVVEDEEVEKDKEIVGKANAETLLKEPIKSTDEIKEEILDDKTEVIEKPESPGNRDDSKKKDTEVDHKEEVFEDSDQRDNKKDIYSSESDSSNNLDNIDDDEEMGADSGGLAAEGKRKENTDTPMSPDKTPPTPDLEEDTLRSKMQIPMYGMYQKAYETEDRSASPAQESDEEKVELERSMKQANYQKLNADKDKKRTKRDQVRTRKRSTSSERDSDSAKSASARRGRSPSDRRSKPDDRSKRQSPPRRTTLDRVEAIEKSLKISPRDSPDWRDSFSRRDRGESPRRRDGRRRSSLEAIHRGKSPEFRRASPDRREIPADRGRRDAFGNRGSPEWNLSPRRRHSMERMERRLGNQRSRDGKEARIDRGRDDDHKADDRDMRRAWEPDSRDRESRDGRDGRYGKESRDREMREGRDFRDKNFRPIPVEAMRDRSTRGRGYNRDRDMPSRSHSRTEMSERGRDLSDRGREISERGRDLSERGRPGYRDMDRPQRNTPPVPSERSRSPTRYGTGERLQRTPEVRAEGSRPRTPEQTRPRSPVMRPGERRRGRSAERRGTPPRGHEQDRQPYRDQVERRERERRDRVKDETPPPPPPPPEPRKEHRPVDPSMHQQLPQQRTSTTVHTDSPSDTPGSVITNPPASGNTPTPVHFTPPPPPPPTNADSLLDLLRRYPVMWQGLFALKNDSAAVQMHYISGNARLAEASLPRSVLAGEVPPPLRISQRMKLEASQLEGVNKRIKNANDHCMLLALPCGRDPLDVHAQTRALKTGFITYLQVKQAAGIINIVNSATKQPAYVLHIFPPCEFAEVHLARVAPDLLDSAADSGHLMVLITPV